MVLSASILFGVIAMIGFGLCNAIAQVPSKEIGSQKTIFFKNIFVSVLLAIPLLFFLNGSFFNIKYILIAFALSLIGYLALVSFYEALKIGKVGIVSPIASSSVIFTIIFSTFFFKESLSSTQIISIILIIIGIILTSLDFSDIKKTNLIKLSNGVSYALITCILWGLVYFLYKIPVTVLGPILTSFITEFGIMIFSGINLKCLKISFDLPNRKILLYIFLVAFFGAIGTIFYNLGISGKHANISIVAALTFSSPLVSTLYGKFVYKEKLSIQQWIAIVLILIGIIVISLFN
jgi:transporter family protein